jgi:hypothetical protein
MTELMSAQECWTFYWAQRLKARQWRLRMGRMLAKRPPNGTAAPGQAA